MSGPGPAGGTYRVPFARRGSVVGEADLAALALLVRGGDTLTSGVWRDRFEERFQQHTGARHALSVTSGTVALELATRLLDLKPGDEVVVTPQTFQATIQPLLGHPGVRVRFCDVDPDTLNMDPDVLEGLVNDRTRAVFLVHYGGNPADMDRIMKIARRHGAVVVEDSAHGLGALYRGRPPGALADIGCFSFHSTKNITTLGEGGMITLARDDWAARVHRLRDNEADGVYVPAPAAAERPALLPWMKFAAPAYQHTALSVRGAGTNATLSEAAAAVGLVQLDSLERFVERRQRIAVRLDEALSAFPGVRLHQAAPGNRHAYHLYTFFLSGGRQVREHFVRTLDRLGVEVQLRYFPLHLLPEWRLRGHRPGECPQAERVWFEEHMNLPCHPGLSDAQVDHLVHTVTHALQEAYARAGLAHAA